MSLNQIEQLLEKYYNGETTVAEEQQLRDFFASASNLPPHLKAEKAQFTYYADKASEKSKDIRPLLENIEIIEAEQNRITLNTRFSKVAFGIAASLLIALSFWLIPKNDSNNKQYLVYEDTYQDPNIALTEVRNIMAQISTKFNMGTQSLHKVRHLNTALNQLQPLSKLEHISKQSADKQTL